MGQHLSRSSSQVEITQDAPAAQSIPNVQAAIGVPIAIGAADASAIPSESCTLHISCDKVAVSAADAHTTTAMISVKAPDAEESSNRAPLDLVLAIDVSGSMRGSKMRLMKQTLELLVSRSGLTVADRIALVTFDSRVQLRLPLTEMGADGRAQAKQIVSTIEPGSTTNLSGGALRAIDVLAQDTVSSEGRTRSVLLFTDGLATDGIRDTPSLVSSVSNALSAASATRGRINLFTFGFGEDHSDECLRALAEGSSGSMYYYVSTPETIPNAFADCLGGLVSVVAQNAVLTLTPVDGGATIRRVLGRAYVHAADGSIELGDLYAQDEKDVLVELELPALPTGPRSSHPVLHASLRFFHVARSQSETVRAQLEIKRPAETPADQPINIAIQVHLLRIEAAENIETASSLADRGDLEAGREQLLQARRRIEESPAVRTPLGLALSAEVDSLVEQYRDRGRYSSTGSKASKMSYMSHAQQRANHSNEGVYSGAKHRKLQMKASWSLAPVDSDEE